MMKIIKENRLFSETTRQYFEKAFVDLVEDHANYLIGLSSTSSQVIEPIETIRYRADLFGYLQAKGYSPKLWIPILVLNRMRDPQNFNESWKNKMLIIPAEREIDNLLTKYKRK